MKINSDLKNEYEELDKRKRQLEVEKLEQEVHSPEYRKISTWLGVAMLAVAISGSVHQWTNKPNNDSSSLSALHKDQRDEKSIGSRLREYDTNSLSTLADEHQQAYAIGMGLVFVFALLATKRESERYLSLVLLSQVLPVFLCGIAFFGAINLCLTSSGDIRHGSGFGIDAVNITLAGCALGWLTIWTFFESLRRFSAV